MDQDKISIDSIFLAAMEITNAEERSAYLQKACGGDTQLRQRVERLLSAQPKMDSFLESPAPGLEATIDQPIMEREGTVIGPYKLLQQIGEGGMGVVYMADQTEPVERRVALKIIKPGMDTREVIARFEAERQALAMMDHPNIAKVLDAGTTDSGRPYFVMELVKGVPITKYCDERHLTARERLELFLSVCHAVQHAHQKGIIHRDLKPSNVLVALYDDRPVPKVIDFGVAKATSHKLTEKTMFTRYGQIVGTLEYMSPEQAQVNQLDVDTRSDIYSLGVLLYELLTGTTPFDKETLRTAAFEEMLRILREDEPPRPSTKLSSSDTLPSIASNRNTEPHKLSALLRGELDWIVMKALEKDRARRYETANGFAADVERYLNDDPVEACPPSAAYRLRKFTRRNKATLVTLVLIATSLLVGTAVSLWQANEAIDARNLANGRLKGETEARKDADEQRRLAEVREKEAGAARKEEAQARQEAEQQRKLAEENFRRARQVVDDMYTQVAEKWLVHQPLMTPLQREFLLKAVSFYEDFAKEDRSDPRVRHEMAKAYIRVGDIQTHLGQRKLALEANNQASLILEKLLKESPDVSAYRHDLARSYFALNTFAKAITLQEMLVADFPNVPEYRLDLAKSYGSLGRKIGRNSPAEAEELLCKAVARQDQLVKEFPQVPGR